MAVGCVMFHVVTGGADGFLTKHFTKESGSRRKMSAKDAEKTQLTIFVPVAP